MVTKQRIIKVQNIKFSQALARRIVAILVWLALSIVPVSPVHADDHEDKLKIVVLGDSLAAGYQLPQGDGYPDKLQAALSAKGINDVEIIGAGVSGDTTSGGLSRLDWSVPEGTAAVLLELGANDSLRGLPPETSRQNLTKMIERLQERGIKIALFGMLAPPNMGEDYAKAFNPIYEDLAQKYELPLYPFFLDGVLTKPEFLLADAIHPNTRGVEIMVGKTLPLVEALIEELRPIP